LQLAVAKKKNRDRHLSLSEVQNSAEAWVLGSLRQVTGYKTLESDVQIPIGDAFCRPDGVTRGSSRIIEIYARVGTLKGSQKKKVATDILKFAAIQQQEEFAKSKFEIFFVDKAALASVTGWMKEAASRFGVALTVIDGLPKERRDQLLVAQGEQAEGMKQKKK